MSPKVAIITGGSSGLGYGVCESLSKKGDWEIHNIDLNAPSTPLPNSTFHKCDITKDQELGEIFAKVFATHRRLDFVFANAGIGGRASFYDLLNKDATRTTTGLPPPPPLPVDSLHPVVNINLNAVITSTYLGAYYMKHSPPSSLKSIVITASSGGLYPTGYAAIYTATKHAVVGFTRGIAPYYYKKAGIRVNAICPGVVQTAILDNRDAPVFSAGVYTPLEKVAAVVNILIEGKDDGTGKVGKEVEDGGLGDVLNGWAVEISGKNHYYRGPVVYMDEGMRQCMAAANVI